jgi:hypothetical protein
MDELFQQHTLFYPEKNLIGTDSTFNEEHSYRPNQNNLSQVQVIQPVFQDLTTSH